MTSASRKARIVVEGASLVGLSLAAFLVRLTWFLTTDEPTGWDGYAFVVQVERLITEGRLHWPDASWVTYFLAVLHLLLPSAILAVKVGGCLLAAAVVPSAWWLGRALERGLPVPWLPWALASWAAASPTLTHLAGDFPKNLGAVAPLLVALGWSGGRRGIGPFVAALL
ncbi:MAG: hypothetical protein AB1938_31610, partial [Myxococcota bacterium]